ncbi:hypothetical protein ACVCNR_14855 [Aquamicrobium terrae]
MTVRVSTMAFGDRYCAVFHAPGRPDEFLVDEAGKPKKFATATEALRQGRKALAPHTQSGPIHAGADPFGIRAWRSQKDEALKAERERVFGTSGPASIERAGRTIVIERRRRR